MLNLKIKKLHPDAKIPKFATPGSAGLDLSAAFDEGEIEVLIGERLLVGTGLAVDIPSGYVGLICPRSGLASKSGITVLNAPGVIDSDYRGEVKVLLINHGEHDFIVRCGDRIAQLVLVPVVQAEIKEVDDLSNTERGANGFGSTGK